MASLPAIFTCANRLTAPETFPDLRTTLFNRLSRYYELRGSTPNDLQNFSCEDLQLLTAKEALNITSDVQQILYQDLCAKGQDSTNGIAVGAHDLAQLRTLISIIFKWGTEPLLSSCLSTWPASLGKEPGVPPSEEMSEQYRILTELTDRLMVLIYPDGLNGPLSKTYITSVVINSHLVDFLKPCLALGWLPRSLSTGPFVTHDSLRPATLRLLSVLSPSQAIAALGGVLSSRQAPSLHMRRISTMLLGKQLTRSQGVRGLFTAVFGDEEMTGEEAPLMKLEHIARVLLTVPQGTQPKIFYHAVVHQVVSLLLSEDAASTHKRAAAFTVSRVLAADPQPPIEICSQLLLASLHASLEQVKEASVDSEDTTTRLTGDLTPSTAISALAILVSNIDPQPKSISRLLSPVVPALYSLLYHLDKVRTSDPAFKETVHGLLVTWGKIVDRDEGLYCIWSIYQGEEIYWSVDPDGTIHREHRTADKVPPLSFFTPESLEDAEMSGSLDDDANIMDLFPDPTHFARFLKELDRSDIASDLFVKLLESYREQRLANGADPLQTLLTLQIVMQMQKQLSTGPSSSNLLCKPAHMLLFIKHVLESSGGESKEQRTEKHSNATRPIDFVPRLSDGLNQIDEIDETADSDDEASSEEVVFADDEMVETAINLLLSILEANDDLSARTMPVLNDIYSSLEPVSRDSPTNIRSVAREARMVMTARLASTSTQRKLRSDEEESVQEIYQKALKLLQDPILPVRAHGLLLLRQLVTRPKPEVNAPLIPAILSVFLQAVQDEEPYLFLNAVQGLAAMVDSYGREVLKSLIREYSDGLLNMDGTFMTQHELDVRTRVGEALGIVVRRIGTALGIYSDLLVPPIFQIVRSPGVPTVLRTSSLSLLADCVNTYPLAILPYVVDLTEAMVDLLQLQAVSATDTSFQRKQPAEAEASEEKDQAPPTMDSRPTSTNPRFPPLRRAALHFFSLLIRSVTAYVYEKSPTDLNIPASALNRAKTTIAYIASADEDNVVRVMARETTEGLAQLQRAMLGF